MVTLQTGSSLSNNRGLTRLLATVTLFVVVYFGGALSYGGMRDPQVFLNLFRTSPFLLISAIGMTFVIISGGIDLSVGGVVALTTVASAALLRQGWNPWLLMLLMLAMGMAFGAGMGAFITYLKVQPFIATLAGMWRARGLCFFISDDAIAINSRVYRILGQTKILIPGLSDPVAKTGDYISILVVLSLLILLAAMVIARFTTFGRTVYAMGGNEQSARLMGLPVNRTKMLVYTLNGFCSALAGITLSIYVLSGHGLYACGFEMTVIAAVVIGGTKLTGGEGTMLGTLFGVLITGLIQTLIQFNGKLSSWWTSIVVGLLMLVFIGMQSLLGARRTRRAATKQIESDGLEYVPPAAVSRTRHRLLLVAGGAAAAIAGVLILLALGGVFQRDSVAIAETPAPAIAACKTPPFRPEQAAALMKDGAVLAYERNGGSTCLDELYGIYPDGRIVGDDGARTVEKQVTPAEVDALLSTISGRGWFSDEMYDTPGTPPAGSATRTSSPSPTTDRSGPSRRWTAAPTPPLTTGRSSRPSMG